MIIKKYILLLLVFLGSGSAFACDICGCFMGITPYDNQSSFSILYRYRAFNGYNDQPHKLFPKNASFFIPQNADGTVSHHAHSSPADYEIYRTMELRGRHFLHKRIELNAIIPYNSNSSNTHERTNTISGPGDINVYGGYHLIRKINDMGISQRLITGLGVKLPTGGSKITNSVNDTYPLLQQPGSGSTDGFVYINYLIGFKKFGASLNSAYKFNGANSRDLSIANSTTQFLNIFQTIGRPTDAIKFVPSVQLSYEYSGGEKSNGVKTGEHLTNNMMAGAGLDLFVKNITFNMGVQGRAWAAENEHTQPSGRVHLGLTYNFNQLYYLINKE